MAEATNPTATRETLEAQRAALVKNIATEISRLKQLAGQDETVEKTKAVARAEYDHALSRGDEKGMSLALAKIRTAHKENDSFIKSLTKSQKTASELRGNHEDLRTESSKLRSDAEKQMQLTRDAFRAADTFHDSVAGLLSSLNELDELLLQTKGRFGVADNTQPCCESS